MRTTFQVLAKKVPQTSTESYVYYNTWLLLTSLTNLGALTEPAEVNAFLSSEMETD